MSELKKLLAIPEEITIGKGEKSIKIKIRPLTLSDYAKLDAAGLDLEKPTLGTLVKLTEITLKKALPDATQDEIDDLPGEYLLELTEHINRVNKFDVDTAESRIKERVKSAVQPTN